jgi:hypothetical protein
MDTYAGTRGYEPHVGDIVVVDGHRVGDIKRTGEILDVMGDAGRRHYLVRWDDDHESIFYPGSDAIIRPRVSWREGSRGHAAHLERP